MRTAMNYQKYKRELERKLKERGISELRIEHHFKILAKAMVWEGNNPLFVDGLNHFNSFVRDVRDLAMRQGLSKEEFLEFLEVIRELVDLMMLIYSIQRTGECHAN